jgi:hypothetical protein
MRSSLATGFLSLLAVAGAPIHAPAQSAFSLGARSGYTGFTGADFEGAGAALILDLNLRYGSRPGFSIAGGGHFSNHAVADDVDLDAVSVYGEGRYTFPVMSDNVLPFVTLRGGYVRQTFTTGSGTSTQDAVQDGPSFGGTLGAEYELSERLGIEVAGLYNALWLDDMSVNGNPQPGTERSGGQWAVLFGIVFRTGGR